MSAGRYRQLAVDAVQWHRNGDHPEDNCGTFTDPETGEEFQGEGQVVRYFRHPDVSGETACQHCGATMHVHGWIDTPEGGYIVCPGDWIITGVKGERSPCKPAVFEATYEPETAGGQPSAEQADRRAFRPDFIKSLAYFLRDEERAQVRETLRARGLADLLEQSFHDLTDDQLALLESAIRDAILPRSLPESAIRDAISPRPAVEAHDEDAAAGLPEGVQFSHEQGSGPWS